MPETRTTGDIGKGQFFVEWKLHLKPWGISFSGPEIRNMDLDNSYKYRDVSSLDMPITVLNALGVAPGKYMRGRILEEIYGPEK